MRPSASSFKFKYIHFSFGPSISSLLLLPRLLVPYIFSLLISLIAHFIRQFLREMWPIQLAFLRCTVCTILISSLTPSSTSSYFSQSVQLIFSILLQPHISKLSRHFSNFGSNFKLLSAILDENFPRFPSKSTSECWSSPLPPFASSVHNLFITQSPLVAMLPFTLVLQSYYNWYSFVKWLWDSIYIFNWRFTPSDTLRCP